MLRRLVFPVLLSAVLVSLVGCNRTPSEAAANRILTGRWELALGRDCRDYGIRSDNLVLHSNGTLEQHFVSVFNQHYDATDGHWSYVPDGSISLDARRNFLTKQPPDQAVGVSIHETLIIEFGNPPVIVLNPHSDCFYRKVGGE